MLKFNPIIGALEGARLAPPHIILDLAVEGEIFPLSWWMGRHLSPNGLDRHFPPHGGSGDNAFIMVKGERLPLMVEGETFPPSWWTGRHSLQPYGAEGEPLPPPLIVEEENTPLPKKCLQSFLSAFAF